MIRAISDGPSKARIEMAPVLEVDDSLRHRFGIGGRRHLGSIGSPLFTTSPPLVFWGIVAGIGAVVAFLAQLGRAKSTYSQLAVKDSVHELAGCVHTLNAILIGADRDALQGLPLTVHAVDGDYLVQILDYVGNQRKAGTKARRTPIHCGVIGKACGEKAAFSGCRTTDNHEDFVRQIVKHYGFDLERAKALDASTQAWIAAPLIKGDGSVEGVLYCDSLQRDFFTEDRCVAIGYAAVGIVFFVGKRYPD
jgi:hypothetical protein